VSPTFEAALRDELQRAVRRPTPRRLGVLAAAVGAVAAGALAAASVLAPGSAAADVKITRENGRVTVLLTDRANDADAIEAALNAEGLDIRVTSAAAGPSNLGRFIAESASDGAPVALERIETEGATFMGFSIPEDWKGTLTVVVGRAAQVGEAYRTFSDAYAAGEPLACTGTLGQPLVQASAQLELYDVQVQVFVNGSPEPPVSLAAALDAGYGGSLITGATAMSPETILVDVAERMPSGSNRQPC
jgi:hypothetical protein